MTFRALPLSRRRFFAPEVIQTSGMDCGPAALKSLLEGFGINISYGRLQEACQTDIDGTSINTIERIALRLGLDAQQIMIPVDHLLLPAAGAVPALLVTRHANMLHFLVAWRRHGAFVQIMDPAKGRRWVREDDLAAELYRHVHPVSAPAWREWAATDEFLDSLGERMKRLGLPHQLRERLVSDAASNPDWRGFGTLDAATRMVASVTRVGGLRRGQEAGRVLQTLVDRAQQRVDSERLIPASYWSVQPDATQADGSRIRFRGAVLVRVRGRIAAAAPRAGSRDVEQLTELSRDLVAAVKEPPARPLKEMFRRVRADGVLTPALIAWGILLGTGAVLMEVLLLRAFLEIGGMLGLVEQRFVAVVLLLVFGATLLLLDLAAGAGVLRLGRRLEARLRMALLEKFPRLDDRYFQSRLISDMSQRAHSLQTLRTVPDLGARFIRASTQIVLTAIGLAVLDPASTPAAAVAAVLALGIPVACRQIFAERELRARTHAAAMSRYYLDSLLGLVAARTHGAERSLRRRHETLAAEWARAGLHLLRGSVVIDGLQSLAGFCLAAWLVLGYVQRGAGPGDSLLFIYWSLTLPILGKELAVIFQRYASHRNAVARILEPLGAPDGAEPAESRASIADPSEPPPGVAIALERVDVRAAGREILRDITLTIPPREHVAIVGRSGAGKSSLAGILLGWHRPSTGAVLVDGENLHGTVLANLRRQTVWVDPTVQLWNRSLFDNLLYGHADIATPRLAQVVETATLDEFLERLPDGLQSLLGEGGALTSGGEGQRVRFARALLAHHVRLVIMDEPFRGLDRRRRHELLARARTIWRDATLICVTHDISETKGFDRVLVLDEGRIVEDGSPLAFAEHAGSAYARLLKAEQSVADLWDAPGWRRLRLRNGSLVEDRAAGAHEINDAAGTQRPRGRKKETVRS